jgi:Subtilase family
VGRKSPHSAPLLLRSREFLRVAGPGRGYHPATEGRLGGDLHSGDARMRIFRGPAHRSTLAAGCGFLVWGALLLVGAPVPHFSAVTLATHHPSTEPLAATQGAFTRKPPRFVDTLWWFRSLRIRRAHRETEGAGVRVALIDNALDPSVPELAGQDVRMRTVCQGDRARPARGLAQSDHGTSMASLIVGSGRGDAARGRGIPGVAPEATLLFYGVDSNPRTPRLNCTSRQIGALIDEAVRDRADIISMSLDMVSDDKLGVSVERALSSGTVIVASAVNTATNPASQYPAAYPGVLAVGAVNQHGRLWRLSPRNDYPAVAAPGVEIGAGGVSPRTHAWTSMYYGTGTSHATAITTGALALVKSRYPNATGDQLVQHVIHTAAGSRGFSWRKGFGFGVVNLPRMLASSPTQWPRQNPLWLSPQDTVDDFPMWSSARIPDPPRQEIQDVVQQQASVGTSTGGIAQPKALAAHPAGPHAGQERPWAFRVGAVFLTLAGTGLALARRLGRLRHPR